MGLNSVVQETMRTIRCLYTDVDKNAELRKIVNEAFVNSLIGLDNLTEAQTDSVMSMIPEAAFQRVAIGQPCVNKEGKVFSVVGIYDDHREFSCQHEIDLYPNFSHPDQNYLKLACLFYDPEKPERQDLLEEKLVYT